MCKYERDLASIVEDTDRKWFCPHTDRRTDGRTDRRIRWNQYTPFNFVNRGYNDILTSIMAYASLKVYDAFLNIKWIDESALHNIEM